MRRAAIIVLLLLLVLPLGGWRQRGGAIFTGGAPAGPCDVLATNATPCVAAHSVTRRLKSSWANPIFQLTRTSDSTTLNVGTLVTTGAVDTSGVAAFCASTTCNISVLYDQSGNGYDLTPPGIVSGLGGTAPAYAVDALDNLPVIMTNLYPAITSLQKRAGNSALPSGAAAMWIYDVRTNELNSHCCGDYGQAENPTADCGVPTNCVYGSMFSLGWGTWAGSGCSTASPMLDLETQNLCPNVIAPGNPSLHMLLAKWNGISVLKFKQGDATSLTSGLTTLYSGANVQTPVVQTGLTLGTGGDNSPSYTAWHEGAIAAGNLSDATDALIQNNVVGFYTQFNLQTNTCSQAYCGPGDIVTTGVKAAYGLRAYSMATRGTKLINVCTPSDAACGDFFSDPTTGALVPTSLGGQSCASVVCTVKTAYELSGGGGPNVTQATIASRPTLSLACTPNNSPCMINTSSGVLFATTGVPAMTVPLTIAVSAKRTDAMTSTQQLIAIGNIGTGFVNAGIQYHFQPNYGLFGQSGGFSNDANKFYSTNQQWQSIAMEMTNPNSFTHVNGGMVPVLSFNNIQNPGTNQISLFAYSGSGTVCQCNMTEAIFIQGLIGNTTARNLSNNQRAYYGY